MRWIMTQVSFVCDVSTDQMQWARSS